MTKVRCNDSFGIDLSQVAAWSKSNDRDNEGEIIIFLVGSRNPIYICRQFVGCQAFNLLHILLVNKFAINLGAGTSPCVEPGLCRGKNDEADGIKLEDIPF